MGKKVLVLTGSARKSGNSEILADALIKGAKSAGHETKKVCLADLSIGGCRGCNGCWNTKGNCVVKDDMKQIEPLLESYDVLVIASPMYWTSAPAQVKAVIDRIYQYDPHFGTKKMSLKESVLLVCGDTEDPEEFGMYRQMFTFFSEFNGMKVRDIIAVPHVSEKGAVLQTDGPARAEKLGENL